jgi:hypothetical protein
MDTRKRRDDSAGLEKIDQRRRGFIQKLAAGTAFAVPMVASFSTDGLSFNQAEAQVFNSNSTNRGGFLSKIIRFFLSFFKFGRPV